MGTGNQDLQPPSAGLSQHHRHVSPHLYGGGVQGLPPSASLPPRGTTEEDLELDMVERADELRRLCRLDDEGMVGVGSPAVPRSWQDLEKSCRKLDQEAIRITSLDISCFVDDDDSLAPGDCLVEPYLDSLQLDNAGSPPHPDPAFTAYSSTSLPRIATSAPPTMLAHSGSGNILQAQDGAESFYMDKLRRHLEKKKVRVVQFGIKGQDPRTQGSGSPHWTGDQRRQVAGNRPSSGPTIVQHGHSGRYSAMALSGGAGASPSSNSPVRATSAAGTQGPAQKHPFRPCTQEDSAHRGRTEHLTPHASGSSGLTMVPVQDVGPLRTVTSERTASWVRGASVKGQLSEAKLKPSSWLSVRGRMKPAVLHGQMQES